MKVKTLRFKDTKEFVHILEGGHMATAIIPDILANTASIETLKKYYETIDPEREIDYDNLEVVEYDLMEVGVVGSDIRNKLSPPKNLVSLLEEYFDNRNPENYDSEKLERLIRKEMNQTKVSIEYLAKLL
jgi:hypothetical protein